jgi:PAS domain S-box-containing protein
VHRNADDQRWHGRLAQVLSDLGVGLVVGLPEQAVVVNDAFCELTGYSAEEVLALRSFVDIFVPEARGLVVERGRRRITGDAEPSRFETEILHRDGRRIPVDVSAQVAITDGQTEIMATFRDLTGQKRVAAELARRARQQEAVAELGRQALVDRDVASLMGMAVHSVARILDVEYVEILELLHDQGALLLRAGVGWEEGLVGRATVPAGLSSPAGFTIASDGPLAVEDLSRDDRFGVPQVLSDHGVVAWLSVVIRGDDQPYGVLAADTQGRRQFSRDDVHFMRAVANVLADAIARAGVEADLATRARQQAAVADLGRRALGEPDLSFLLGATVDAVTETLDVPFVKILELLPGSDTLLLRAGAGCEDGLVGQATIGAGSDSQAWFTLAEDSPVVVEDLGRETRFHAPQLLVNHGVVSGMSVIVFGRDRPWGVLGAHATERRRFSANDVNFLQAVANVLAEAIGRLEVEGSLRNAHDRERRLRQRLEAHSHIMVEAQEGERRRIARELHDEIGQALTGLKLTLEDHDRLSAEAVADRLARAGELTAELLQRVQDLSLDLRPAMLDDLGLRPALLWLVERYSVQTGVDVAMRCSGLDRRLRPEVETAAYRIVQEALTNVARHAGVKHVAIDCAVAEDELRVEVTDEGAGFEVDAIPVGKSSGLAGMEERARSTGGSLWLRSGPNRGTTIVALLPIA